VEEAREVLGEESNIFEIKINENYLEIESTATAVLEAQANALENVQRDLTVWNGHQYRLLCFCHRTEYIEIRHIY
jgi:hypothetical protein